MGWPCPSGFGYDAAGERIERLRRIGPSAMNNSFCVESRLAAGARFLNRGNPRWPGCGPSSPDTCARIRRRASARTSRNGRSVVVRGGDDVGGVGSPVARFSSLYVPGRFSSNSSRVSTNSMVMLGSGRNCTHDRELCRARAGLARRRGAVPDRTHPCPRSGNGQGDG